MKVYKTHLLHKARQLKHWFFHINKRKYLRERFPHLGKFICSHPATKKINADLLNYKFQLFGIKLGVLLHHPPKTWDPFFSKITPKLITKTPKVSIVTPSYQQGEFIARTIDSILSQGYSNLEYIIQDGGSKDDTCNVVEQYQGRICSFTSFPDGGQSNAINLGFQKATGEIMGWLNSDDLLLPGALNTVVDFFNSHPKADVVYGNRLLIDENDKQIGVWILPNHHDSEALQWADYIPQETLFWRRSAWVKIGSCIDTDFKFAMDWDLLLRLQNAQLNICHIPNFLGAFRVHSQQKSSANIHDLGRREMNILRERNLGRLPSDQEIYDAVTPFLKKHRAAHFRWLIKTKVISKMRFF